MPGLPGRARFRYGLTAGPTGRGPGAGRLGGPPRPRAPARGRGQSERQAGQQASPSRVAHRPILRQRLNPLLLPLTLWTVVDPSRVTPKTRSTGEKTRARNASVVTSGLAIT